MRVAFLRIEAAEADCRFCCGVHVVGIEKGETERNKSQSTYHVHTKARTTSPGSTRSQRLLFLAQAQTLGVAVAAAAAAAGFACIGSRVWASQIQQ